MDYACFNCLENNSQNDTHCHKCGEKLKYLATDQDFPKAIGSYHVIKPLSRGFYGMTFVAKDDLDMDVVLKIIPKDLYQKHDKDFIEECKLHVQAQQGVMHLVKLTRKDEANVSFETYSKDCHIAVLEYLDGITLKQFVESSEKTHAITIAQIAIDLLKMLEELKNKQIHHNDLHAENIMVVTLNQNVKRSEEIDPFIKVIAIDLGSIADENKSGGKSNHSSDMHWVAKYIKSMSAKLIDKPDETDDIDYRVALVLDEYASHLMPETTSTRLSTSYNEIIEAIRDSVHSQTTSWSQKELKLKNFDAFYNAQTLDFWNIPDLFVDEDAWINRVSNPGPSVIMGMRGCGKTMLLKAIQIHARIKQASIANNHKANIIESIKKDGYIGLYISSNRLLDEPGLGKSIFEPLLKLFITYGLEAIKAIRHLKEIEFNAVKPNYYSYLLDVYKGYFQELEEENINSDSSLERALNQISAKINKNEGMYSVSNAIHLFPALAEAIQKASPLLKNHYVLFLLDDISTRYLSEEEISKLISSLSFHHEKCAFKFTSEAQTILPLLRSPGYIEKAKAGRDFDIFDFGHEIYEKTKGKPGQKFVLSILNKRKEYSVSHPRNSPDELLGDCPLNQIAKNIRALKQTKSKEGIYYGLSALAGVCVGDIGDILQLYSNILAKRKNNEVPIQAKIQNEAFMEISNQRLHDLNKRSKQLKNYAISFADASHDMLINSSTVSRLREYNSIYINNDSNNPDEYYEKIREMIDAGIFVYSGGSSTPRITGSATNPINQFVLSYRKILGLSKLIGISQADRFELSGKNLEDWLNEPENGVTILKRSVEKKYGETTDASTEAETMEVPILQKQKVKKPIISLFDLVEDKDESFTESKIQYDVPLIAQIEKNELGHIDTMIASIGFEDRSIESLKRCLKDTKPREIILIKYNNSSDDNNRIILEYMQQSKIPYEVVNENDLNFITDKYIKNKNILLDISGMSKKLIFHISKHILFLKKTLILCHTYASSYAPYDEELKPFLADIENSSNKIEILDLITDKVAKGEELSNIQMQDLIKNDVDETRRRVLFAACDAKYEKLFYLLQEREFDVVDLFINSSGDMKSELATFAGEVIKMSYAEATLSRENTNNLNIIMESLVEKYHRFYVNQMSNIELAMTGNKIFSVACAIMCTKYKISKCWYLSPSKWEEEQFSKGTGKTEFYKVDLAIS
jgi:serine/threonine protein kinase